VRRLSAGVFLAFITAPVLADKAFPSPHPEYKAECGSCHVAYPARLLPPASWQQLMTGLDRHFGSDASLDARAHAEISRHLAANAGRRAPPPGAEPRITATRWFLKEHGVVKDPSNCIACHAGAEQGNYDDD
jgi:hypothetical protein